MPPLVRAGELDLHRPRHGVTGSTRTDPGSNPDPRRVTGRTVTVPSSRTTALFRGRDRLSPTAAAGPAPEAGRGAGRALAGHGFAVAATLGPGPRQPPAQAPPAPAFPD